MEEEPIRNSRRKRKKRTKLKNVIGLFKPLIFVVLAVFLILFLRSGLFIVTDYEISGNSFYTESQIKDLCGINTGKNIFFETKLRPARDGLLSSPYIKTAKISRRLPHTVVIEVEERAEFAAVPFGEQFVITDEEGLTLRISDDSADLPVLSGYVISESMPGNPLVVDRNYDFTKCLGILEKVKNMDFYFERIDVSSISAKAYIDYDSYYCEGTLDNISDSLASIKIMASKLYLDNISHGVIVVGSNNYLVYQP